MLDSMLDSMHHTTLKLQFWREVGRYGCENGKIAKYVNHYRSSDLAVSIHGIISFLDMIYKI